MSFVFPFHEFIQLKIQIFSLFQLSRCILTAENFESVKIVPLTEFKIPHLENLTIDEQTSFHFLHACRVNRIAAMANFEKLLSENLKVLNDRIGRYGGMSQNPYESYQIAQRFPSVSSQLSSPSSPVNPFGLTQGGVIDHTINSPHPSIISSSEFGQKFASSGAGYPHSGIESQSYSAPQWPSSPPKEEKLKGAALSALTFLAFLFFLNLLQTCMKEHIDVMHPGVS